MFRKIIENLDNLQHDFWKKSCILLENKKKLFYDKILGTLKKLGRNFIEILKMFRKVVKNLDHLQHNFEKTLGII